MLSTKYCIITQVHYMSTVFYLCALFWACTNALNLNVVKKVKLCFSTQCPLLVHFDSSNEYEDPIRAHFESNVKRNRPDDLFHTDEWYIDRFFIEQHGEVSFLE